MSDLCFFVADTPVAQPRPRFRVVETSKARIVKAYTPAKHPVNEWKTAIQAAAYRARRQWDRGREAIAVELVFCMPRPAGKVRKTIANNRFWHGTRPDADNLAKAVCDALTGVLWHDDSVVCRLGVTKFVAGDGDTPGVAIKLNSLDRPTVPKWAGSLISALDASQELIPW